MLNSTSKKWTCPAPRAVFSLRWWPTPSPISGTLHSPAVFCHLQSHHLWSCCKFPLNCHQTGSHWSRRLCPVLWEAVETLWFAAHWTHSHLQHFNLVQLPHHQTQKQNSLTYLVASAQTPPSDLCNHSVIRDASLITEDPSHPLHHSFHLLPSGKTVQSRAGPEKRFLNRNCQYCSILQIGPF